MLINLSYVRITYTIQKIRSKNIKECKYFDYMNT